MSWQLGAFTVLALVLISGGVWFERSRPSARVVAAVAALAALGVAGRVALAPLPNVVATTDVALLAGYTLGGAPGFAVGALSALVSNFWLGQGPWTPWQMAGWGMVGVGGAALALVSGRRLNRWGLAAAAAVAGLMYGALLDLSAMVNFGGEQSLDRYLALSARGVPFNVAHALGNAALMLAAGPALVRMLSRYRERFDVRWSERSAIGAGVAAVVVATLASAPLLVPPPGAAADADAAGRSQGRAWLAGSQNPDGGFGTAPGASSSPGMTGWAMLGLEAAGRNPRDLRRGGRTPVEYLRRSSGELSSTGDLERTILALEGAGINARNFAGRDLVAALRRREAGNGSYESQINLTAFAVLARRATGDRSGPLGRSLSWLQGAQNRDGGWGSTAGAPSEADSTGAVLQALASAGAGGLGGGLEWLASSQRSDGGWPLKAGGDSNSQSTAWALQGLIAAGRNPAAVAKRGNSGLDYLARRQRSDGRYAYSRSSDQTPVWVTAQALTGVARAPFPIAAVARNQSSGDGGGGSGSSGAGGGGGGGDSGGGGSSSGAGGSTSGGGSGNSSNGKSKAGGSDRPGGRGGQAGGEADDAATAAALTGAASDPAAATAEAPSDSGGSGPAPGLLVGGAAAAAALAAVALIGRRRYWW